MDSRNLTLAAFIDFQKAFDRVQHQVLLDKLSRLKLENSVLDWVKSYLYRREQRVYANRIYSSAQIVEQGVPQGSVLDPLFYIIYANDLVNIVKHCQKALNVDDTVLYTSNRVFDRSVLALQNDLNRLSNWCSKNGIMANTDKTKIMIFGSPSIQKKIQPFNIKFGEIPLENVTSYNYLGLTLDSQLNYNLHVNRLIASVSGKLKQFQRMRGFLNAKAAMMVYKNMLLPILEYGDIFLTATSAVNKKRLQTLQNKGVRCALSMGQEAHSADLHEEAKLLKLKYRREQHLLNFLYDKSLGLLRGFHAAGSSKSKYEN